MNPYTWLFVSFGIVGALVVWFGPRHLEKMWGRLIGKPALDFPTDGVSAGERKDRDTDKDKTPVLLQIDAVGLSILEQRPPTGRVLCIPWPDITRVAAYKLDLFTVDRIMLGFRLANGAELEFPEETEGWTDLARGLHEHLPGSIPFHEWFMAVAFPAFQINFTEIFKREPASQVELSREQF